MPTRSFLSPAVITLAVALGSAGCTPQSTPFPQPASPIPSPGATAPLPTVSPSAYTGPTPPPDSACVSPVMSGDLYAGKWLTGTLQGRVVDAAGTPVSDAAISARITRLGDLDALRKTMPSGSVSWSKGADGVWNCTTVHVLDFGDFTKFPSGSDAVATATDASGQWEVAQAPANATVTLTVSKAGYLPLTREVLVQSNPDAKPEINRYDLTLSKP